jgi:T5SS/PEP-CTERM-associated repeat protein
MNHPLSSRPVKLLLLALAVSAQAARAEIRFITGANVNSQAKLKVSAQVMIRPDELSQDPDPAVDPKPNVPTEEFEFLNFEESISGFARKEGLTSQSRAEQSTKIVSTANLLTCTSIGTTEGKSTRTGNPLKDNGTNAEGLSIYNIGFEVDGRSTFSIIGSGSVDSELTSATIRLQGTGHDPDDDEADLVELDVTGEASGEPGKPRSFSISKNGRLGAGSYNLSVSCSAFAGATDASSRSKFNVSLRVTSVPAPVDPEVIPQGNAHWIRRGSGAFSVPANWNPQAVPLSNATQQDAALFDLRGSYTVALGGGLPVVDLIRVRGGSAMTLSGGTLSAISTEFDVPSFIASGNARLTIPSGGTLRTVRAVVGNDPGTSGEVRVAGTGATWRSSGFTVGRPLTEPFTVGGEGTGRITVSNGGFLQTDDAIVGGGTAPGFATITGEGSQWFTEKLTVGFPSEGGIGILEGGTINSLGRVEIGSGASNSGLSAMRIQGLGTSGLSSIMAITNGGLFVGKDVPGSLEVFDGGLVNLFDGPDLRDGLLSINNLGQVRVRGVQGNNVQATIDANDVSLDGGGFLLIEAGGLVKSDGHFFVGGAHGRGDVTIDGLSRFGIASELRVTSPDDIFDLGGTNTDGVLNILNSGSASIVCKEMHIGGDGGGHGAVFVTSNNPAQPESFLSVTGPLKIGSPVPGGGTGLLRITDSAVEVHGDVFVGTNGRIDGRGTLTISGTLHNSGFIEPGLSPGTLRIEGNFEQDATGVVVAEVGGPKAGTQHDQFIVTGTSNLGGRLVLQFINGYAPKAGDHFTVLNAAGANTGAFAAIEVAGLDPGAQFQTASSGGVFTATAMNNTTALPTVSIRAVGKKAFEKNRRKSALIVSRKGSKASKVNPLTINYEISGTAENGIDYTFLPGSVTIPAGKSAVVLTLQPFDDSSPEGLETAEFLIIPGQHYSNSLKAKTQVTIVNNKLRN